jgi:hypothetical protein
MSGNVNFTPAGENDWVQAQLNRPVVTGDRLWTADGSRAELQVGSSTIRLDNGSNFDFLNLNDQIAQMELTSGSLNLDVYRLNANETYEVDTPTIAFVANRVGDYRIDVDPTGGFTTVTARRGGGDVVGQGGKRVTIEEGQSLRFHDSSLNDYQTNRVAAQDDFDYYCSRREERHERAASRNYVSDRVVGYEDLDEYGTWEQAPAYGHVWYPSSVSVGWAPYHHGHWAWIDPWGWTWVDDAPWGYAPFHYGRWAYIDTRWGWVPGPIAVEPVYAPALVAFVGGGGFGLSVSVGGPVGWFALGPGDVYFPGYGASSNYFSRVNVSNTYVNQNRREQLLWRVVERQRQLFADDVRESQCAERADGDASHGFRCGKPGSDLGGCSESRDDGERACPSARNGRPDARESDRRQRPRHGPSGQCGQSHCRRGEYATTRASLVRATPAAAAEERRSAAEYESVAKAGSAAKCARQRDGKQRTRRRQSR